MPLTMRPTGLSSGFPKDTIDYSVFCGASAASTSIAAARRICVGSGLCMHPADEKLSAHQIGWRHLRRPWKKWNDRPASEHRNPGCSNYVNVGQDGTDEETRDARLAGGHTGCRQRIPGRRQVTA
jgi:hypothetical protein